MEETAGVGQAVDLADDGWRGALYAGKVNKAMEQAPKKLAKLEKDVGEANLATKTMESLITKIMKKPPSEGFFGLGGDDNAERIRTQFKKVD